MAITQLPKRFLTKYGRVILDIMTYNFLAHSAMPAAGVLNPTVCEGMDNQRKTQMTQITKRLFGVSNGGVGINVQGVWFTIHCEGRTATFTPGMVDTVYMGSFPYLTTLVVHGPMGQPIYRQFNNIGTPDPQTRKKRFS